MPSVQKNPMSVISQVRDLNQEWNYLEERLSGHVTPLHVLH